jgi:integrase/recombinase XerC
MLDQLLRNVAPSTALQYRRSVEACAVLLGLDLVELEAELLRSPEDADRLLAQLAAQLALRLAPDTVAFRLAPLRSLLKLARDRGVIAWRPAFRFRGHQGIRDTRGPGMDGYRALLEATRPSPIGARDRCALHLLWDLALRRSEACALQLEDLDLQRQRVKVRGKGGRLDALHLPGPTAAAVEAWLHHRNRAAGPLLCACAWSGAVLRPLRPLAAGQLWRRLQGLAEAAGIPPTRPHGLRHSAITLALDATGGDVRRCKAFSRHVHTDTLLLYDDQAEAAQRTIAEAVAAAPLLPVAQAQPAGLLGEGAWSAPS